MRRAVLLLAGAVSVGAQCMDKAECDRQLNARIKDVRSSIVDTVQSELEEFLQIAPTAILLDDVKHEEQLIDITLSTANGRDSLAQLLYYQLQSLPELYWVYYGEESSGRFLGFRRATPTEINNANLNPRITSNMLIRTECAGTGQPMEFFRTDATDSSGGDAVGAAFDSTAYNLAGRDWFTQGLALANQADMFTDANYAWTPTYTFSDGTTGLSAVRRVEDRPHATGARRGVLAADYALKGISAFITALPIPNREDGSRTPVLVIDGPNKKILAANVDNLEGQNPEQQSVNSLVRQASIKMYQTQPGYGGTTGWSTLRSTAAEADIDATTALTAVGLEYPAGGASPVRWVSLIVSDIDMGYRAVDPGCILPTQTGAQACRETLITATLDFRERTLNFLAGNTKEYLGVAYVLVNSLDESYNLGLFNNGWCTTCGTLELTDAAERANLDVHMKNLLTVYEEVYWVYYATNADRQYLGYLRPAPTTYQRWECNGGVDSSTCGTAKFTWADNGTVASTDATDPLTRPWYTNGWALNYDKLFWTNPYQFGNGAVGISIVKKSFGGDWDQTTGSGVFAADFSLDFLAAYISTIQVDAGWIVYIMSKNGLLLGSTNAAASDLGAQASSSANSVIRGSSPTLLALGNDGLWKSTRESTSFIDPTTNIDYFVDYVGLQDTATDVVQSYDWVFVLCAPESSLYNIDVGTLSSGSGREQILISLLMAAVAAMAAFVH